MAETVKSDRGGDEAEPLNLQQRRERGFCTCPLRMPDGSLAVSDPERCRVHAYQKGHYMDYNHDQSNGRLFFDERRHRYVTWEDAVEGMRQPRYAGASSKGLVLFTWMNLMRMLEALCHPTREPAAEMTEPAAEQLIKWAGQNFPPDQLRSLMALARGGQSEALCQIFRSVALHARETAPVSGAS